MVINRFHAPVFLLILSFVFPNLANANSVNVQTLSPPYNLVYGTVESALPDPIQRFKDDQAPVWFLGVHYNFVKSPLVTLNTERNHRINVIVDQIQTFDLSAGWFFLPWLSVYAQAPVHVVKLTGRSDTAAFGDMRLSAKAQLNDSKDPVVFSLIPELRFPTGDNKRFVSDDSVGFGGMLAVEKRWDYLGVVGNIGYRNANSADYFELSYRNRMPFGIGVMIPFAEKWALNGDYTGAVILPTNTSQNYSELYGGLNFHPEQHYAFLGGVSSGRFDGVSAVDYRIHLGFRMMGIGGKAPPPPQEEPKPEPPAVMVQAITEPLPPPPAREVVKYTTREIQVLEEIKFKHDSYILTDRSKEILDEVASVIRQYIKNIKKLEVQGHANRIGSHPYNDKLSQNRANAVRAYLIKKKVPAKILTAKGYGKRVPKTYPKKTSDALRLIGDRRVEFHIIESKSSTQVIEE